uniref:Uncharacterized protein n=1 Tax=Globodera rostochiensis TaxID=31243 RepID=A0A914I9M6_GLORO
MKWPAFLRRFTTAEEDDIALDEPLLVLRRNVLFTLDREILFTERYERLTEVLYLNARDEYLSGRYLVAIEFGTYSGDLEDALDLLYAAFYSGTIDSSHVRPRVNGGTHHNPLQNRGTQSSDVENQSDHSAGSSSPCSSTKSNKSTLSLGSFFSFLRNHFLHHHHHQQQRGSDGGKHNGTGSRHRQDDILIGINHTHITLIEPRQHKVLDVFGDRSPEGNMSLNEKIALFCNAD